ncbi:MAG: phytoene/squalene synthase family protein [Nocardioidaceae bacterium]
MTGFIMDEQSTYAVCEQITRREARNFSYGIRLLPRPKRQALSAIYATARRIDDIGDGDLPAQQKLTSLAGIRDSLHHLPDREFAVADPVLSALADAASRFPIPLAAFDEIVAGCRADVTVHRYASFDDLVGYCRSVAGSVGRLSVGVYDPPALERAWSLADTLGIALQLTNVLRDLLEDRLVDRIYLPTEDLRRFGCTLDANQGRLSDPADRFAALIRFEAERADNWYQRGLRLLPLLDRRSAACTAAMAGIYRRLLRRIAADPEAVRSRRLSLPSHAKAAVAVQALARGTA